MIVSYSNNFVFVKTRKTGGTSVELVLSTWCSGRDVCSKVSPEDEETRKAMRGLAPTRAAKGGKVYNHMSAAEIRDMFPDSWARAFKFVVERHPFEKVVSRAYWNIGRRGDEPAQSFERVLHSVISRGVFIDRDLYLIDGKIAVDEVVLYDQLWPRIGRLGETLGKSMPAVLPRAKGQHRKDRRPATEILSEDQKARIRDMAGWEFETFGFDPA